MARTVKVEGLRELEKSMKILTKATGRNALRRALVKAGQPIADAAVRNAPRQYGDLEGSIRVSTRVPHDANEGKKAFASALRDTGDRGIAGAAARAANRGSTKDFAEAFVGPGRNPQAIMQEFGRDASDGHPGHGAQPFMRPAWDAEQDNALSIARREIEADLGRAVARAQRKAARQR